MMWTNYTADMKGSVPGGMQGGRYVNFFQVCERKILAASYSTMMAFDLDTMIWEDISGGVESVLLRLRNRYLSSYQIKRLWSFQGDFYCSVSVQDSSYLLINRNCGESGWEEYLTVADTYTHLHDVIFTGSPSDV